MLKGGKIQHQKPAVILVYANWCGHCTDFKPVWKNLKSSLSNSADFLDIEETYANKRLPTIQSEYGLKRPIQVEGYPTLLQIRGGNVISYRGERSFDKVKNWILGGSMKGGRKTKRSKKLMSKTRKNRK